MRYYNDQIFSFDKRAEPKIFFELHLVLTIKLVFSKCNQITNEKIYFILIRVRGIEEKCK